ncbi:MAG TPA: cation-translocating P-type ATPase [Patescibacteria group bacterium]|nr:cation-translocating P-type ATPase [Patescibacteria group bacterium]
MDEILEKAQGLSLNEVSERLKKHGLNELPSQKNKSVFTLLFNLIKEPMLLLLIAAGGIYLLLGEPRDASLLLVMIFLVIGTTVYQERKTEKALEALKGLSSPRALVIRDGEQIRIAGKEVVMDDLIILREGDRIPADALIISQRNLMIDESLLTGESLAVSKSDWDKKTDPNYYKTGREKIPLVFSGTMVTQGHGLAKVLKTGIHTEMGKIGKSLQTIREEDTLLKKEINKLVRNFAIWSAILCTLVVVLYFLIRGNLLEGILSGVSLSMSLIPEEFPIIFIVFMTLGAWRISKRNVLTRNTSAIETLGAARVLCIDKTGTITFNKMQLETLVVDDSEIELEDKNSLDETFHKLLEYSILASQKDPFDPIEKEIRTTGTEILKKDKHPHLHKDWNLIREYPLSKHLFALSHVWESPDKNDYVIAAKGAPESIFDLCHLGESEQKKLFEKVEALSEKGMRLIAVARAKASKKELPKSQHDFNFELVGILGFSDPVRPGINQAIKECYQAGIRVIMITGDYPGTARFIGNKIGLKNTDKFLTGEDIAKMDESKLREEIKDVNIFARVVPEQKLLIVKALKANGEIVAMTGDGVNDAPALKAAHIGIAMGERGTDVARETADLVLLKDDFASIVESVRLGRRIFDNLKKAISYVFAIHVPIAGMTLIPIALNLPIVLFPAHIAFLELIVDPSSSIVFEAEPAERNIMSKLPRNLRSPLFNKRAFIISILQGASALSIVLIVYMFSLYLGKGEEEVRTLTFATIVFSNLMLVVTNLSWSKTFVNVFMEKNKALYGVFFLALFFLILITSLPFLQNLFHFTTLHLDDVAITLTAGIFSILWFEGFKIVVQKKKLSKLPLKA